MWKIYVIVRGLGVGVEVVDVVQWCNMLVGAGKLLRLWSRGSR